jgi:hypothetical protein
MSVYKRLLQPENLNYAWIKAKNLYRTADGFIDSGEIASFELDLERRLADIRRQFERGTYRLNKLRPLPRPKKIAEERPVDRQYYHVAIEDQVAWIALVNALGPELDLIMQPWSYGNRLYRSAWYATDEARGSTLEIGPYRHASGHLYRKFQHSWPLFRRHVTLTARMMVLKRPLRREEMDEADQLAAVTAEHQELAYFSQGFWPQSSKDGGRSDLYHASIDLKQFYPELNIDAVVRGLAEGGAMADLRIANIVKSMLKFQIDMSGMPEAALELVEPPFLKGRVKGIPTGLFVSGFLANAAMLPIDRIVARKIRERRDIAHFRFVDDHTILAFDFDALCDWIFWYEKLLENEGIGPGINAEKSDPPGLGAWIKHLKSNVSTTELRTKYPDDYGQAMREARLDGKNPTKLMTKTLAQVSAIAAADIHILDDGDLGERLKMLEWLLLADIPEREIRPDTRAAFAAGQIASLVQVLVQETDGLVDAARQVAAHKAHQPSSKRATEDELRYYEETRTELEKKLKARIEQHEEGELALLSRCFALLLQSLREHPGKARLFHRIHQYCQVTGYHGLRAVAEWLKETRSGGQESWADYYSALSLQIMARGALAAVHRLAAPTSMRSDVKAAASHLEDIAKLDITVFRIAPERETWYHAVGRQEFGVALIQVAETLAHQPGRTDLGRRIFALSQNYVSVLPGARAEMWVRETGRTSGVWAHLAEDGLGTENSPSAAWSALAPYFNFDRQLDLRAARRYPERLPQEGWLQLLAMTDPVPENDSAWLRDVIGNDESRRAAAQASGKLAFMRAARSLDAVPRQWITMGEWTEAVHACSPFDPRRSEWTALEIAAQLLVEATSIGSNESMLDRLHPNNVLLPREWVSAYPSHRERTELSWETWRHFVQEPHDVKYRARLRNSRSSLADYRYAPNSKGIIPTPDAERRLVSVGRLLLGLIRNNHTAPRIWNLRGNEQIYHLPRARWFQMLAISSPTTLILEACLGARSAETRAIRREPALFGWRDGVLPNDATFDPPTLFSSTDLLEEIRKAQKVLEDNQLAVAQNQPRQLIPFRLADFSAGADIGEAADGEGGGDGE